MATSRGSERIIVVGGGVVGLACAYYMARDGRHVTVLERKALGAEASGANVGLVMVSTKPPGPLLDMARDSARLFAGLERELEAPVYYRRPGSLSVFPTDEARAAGEARAEALRGELEGTLRLVSAEEAAAMEPVLSPRTKGGLYYSLDGDCYPFAVVQAFAAAARRRGAVIRVGVEVTGLVTEAGRIAGVVVRGEGGIEEQERADAVVVAAGAWTGALLHRAGIAVNVRPVKGQVLVTERTRPLIRRVIMGGTPSARQTFFGNVVIGSETEDAGFDKTTDRTTTCRFAHGVCDLFPGLRALSVIRSWAGLRPVSDDQRPLIGSVSRLPGLLLATAHFQNGLCFAPSTGRIIADIVAGREPPSWARAFAPDRLLSPA